MMMLLPSHSHITSKTIRHTYREYEQVLVLISVLALGVVLSNDVTDNSDWVPGISGQ